MIPFLIIVTAGLIYAACVFEPNLFWILGAAALVEIAYDVFWKGKPELSHDEEQIKLVLERFFSEMKHSPWSKRFDQEVVRERLETLSELFIKALYKGIQEELKEETDEIYCKNLQFTLIDIRQEIANRQIEAYRHAKREKKGNYARIYADSLEAQLLHENLNDEEALKTVAQYSDAELVFAVLDTPEEIHNTTAELTTGREEEMEAYYHNNLRRIEFLLRIELAKRFLEN